MLGSDVDNFAVQCYYVGGLEESATGMLSEMSKPVSWAMPADKICMKLYRRDEQICDLRYGIHLLCCGAFGLLMVPSF